MKYLSAVLVAVAVTALVMPEARAQASYPSQADSESWATLKAGVRTLVQAHVSDAVTIAYIKRNSPGVQPSIRDLIELKEAGASDAVLTALLETASRPVPVPPPSYSGDYSSGYSDGSSGYVYTPPDYSYDYSGPYYYPYSWWYPYWGFGLGFGHDRFHDGRFHDGHFHDGHVDNFNHFHGTVITPHNGIRGGQVVTPHTFAAPHGGVMPGGGMSHGGGGHGGGGGHR
jgi:hypothetical protein